MNARTLRDDADGRPGAMEKINWGETQCLNGTWK